MKAGARDTILWVLSLFRTVLFALGAIDSHTSYKPLA